MKKLILIIFFLFLSQICYAQINFKKSLKSDFNAHITSDTERWNYLDNIAILIGTTQYMTMGVDNSDLWLSLSIPVVTEYVMSSMTITGIIAYARNGSSGGESDFVLKYSTGSSGTPIDITIGVSVLPINSVMSSSWTVVNVPLDIGNFLDLFISSVPATNKPVFWGIKTRYFLR